MAAEEKVRVYVINLDRSADRLAQFMASNSLPGLDIVRVRAVDGKDLDRAALVSQGTVAGDLIYSNNAVACTLSHMSVWREVIASGQPAVVCEDDAILRRDFPLLHRHFAQTIAAVDLVYWSANFGLHMIYEVPGLGEFTAVTDDKYLATPELEEAFQASTGPVVLYRPKRVWGTACYTITPSGAGKLTRLVLPMRNGKIETFYRTGLWMQPRKCTFPSLGLDGDMGLLHLDKLEARIAFPPIAVPRVTASTIDSGREEERYQAPFRDQDGNIHVPLPLASPNIGALNDTGLALHGFQQFEVAIRYFDAALARAPGLPEPHYNRANALVALGRLEEALAGYDRAIELRPTYASAYNNRGFTLQQLGRFEEAIACYDQVLELEPSHPRASANREAVVQKMEAAAAQQDKVTVDV